MFKAHRISRPNAPLPDSRRLRSGIAYALVICNHAPSPGRVEDYRGNELGIDQTFATAVRGKYSKFALYRQKSREMEKKNNKQTKTVDCVCVGGGGGGAAVVFYQRAVPAGWGV